MKRALLIFIGVCLFGCSPTVKQITAPDGRPAHRITCNERDGLTLADCWEAAGKLCGGRGYDVLGQNENKSERFMFGVYRADAERDVFVRCR